MFRMFSYGGTSIYNFFDSMFLELVAAFIDHSHKNTKLLTRNLDVGDRRY